MAFNKTKLTTDLKGWMDNGANNMYPVVGSGIPPLINIIQNFVSDGEDSFGNKIIGYSGSILSSLLLTLVVPGTTLFTAIQFATGFNGDFSGCQLSMIFGPLNMLNGISNIITIPPTVPSAQPLFVSSFSQNYDNSLLAAINLADAINSTCKQAVSTLTYTQNIPPLFPPAVITSPIS